MRDYGKVATAFWTSDDVRGLSDGAKLLALFLLTGPHSNMVGAFRLPLAYLEADLGWDRERAVAALAELVHSGFVIHDPEREEVGMPAFLKWNPLENPNQWKAARKLLEQLPQHGSVFTMLAQAVEPFRNRFETVRRTVAEPLSRPLQQGLPNQKQEQEQEPEQKPDAKQETLCAPPNVAPEPAVLTLPLNDGSEFGITQAVIDECGRLYPAVDTLQEFRAMRGWLLGNKQNRKTRSGVMRFAHSWLKRAQDRGPAVQRGPAVRTNGYDAEELKRRLDAKKARLQ